MRFSEEFYDYELIDAAKGLKLERWKDIYLIRPEPQAIWSNRENNHLWEKAHAVYHRSNSGGGYWERLRDIPDVWQVSFKDLTFNLKPMGFKHTGLFPEQAVNWDLIKSSLKPNDRVLNLFAYTGGATLAALSSGCIVTHVDASKGMTLWAKENATSSGLINKPVRWIVDDCIKFIKREIRRGNRYECIIMDPPSYGRGPNKEVFKIDDMLEELLTLSCELLSEKSGMFILNTYTAGISHTILNYLLKTCLQKYGFSGEIFTDEIGLKVTHKSIILPCGNTTIWKRD